jgi:hypothetical protein
METVIVGLAALIIGCVLGYRSGVLKVSPLLPEVLNTQAIDRANFTLVLRREIANVLVWRNPQRYLECYSQLHKEIGLLKGLPASDLARRLTELSTKYPNYSDFDAIGTREYVLYADGASAFDYDELVEKYRELVLFNALSVLIGTSWKDAFRKGFVHLTDDIELEHLKKYCDRIEDTKFRFRLEQAIQDNYLIRSGNSQNLNNEIIDVIDLPHFAEIRYGVRFKSTNEYGIYSSYSFDDGRQSETYYRSNASFELEQVISPLHSVSLELAEFARY